MSSPRNRLALHPLADSLYRLAFFDIGPISKGHALVIPKCASSRRDLFGRQADSDADHGAKLHDIPDADLVELLPIVKKIAVAVGTVDYNVLQVSEAFRWSVYGGSGRAEARWGSNAGGGVRREKGCW